MYNQWYEAVSGAHNYKMESSTQSAKNSHNPLGNFKCIYTILKYIFNAVTNVWEIKSYSNSNAEFKWNFLGGI